MRDIDMLPPVRQALMEQKALSWLLGGYVFLDGKQQTVHQELFRMKVWEPLLRRLGLRYRPPYQMRHTFATLAISAGENINWVARMLGQESRVMTLEYNGYVPNLTRTDGKAHLAVRVQSKRLRGNGKNRARLEARHDINHAAFRRNPMDAKAFAPKLRRARFPKRSWP